MCHTSRHEFAAERKQLEKEAEAHSKWVGWKQNAGNPLRKGEFAHGPRV